jgi:hypothetical protein
MATILDFERRFAALETKLLIMFIKKTTALALKGVALDCV